MTEKTPSLTAIVPAYNEAERIRATIMEIKTYVDEVLVIDDGSEDETAQEAEMAGARVVRQPHNQGYIQAIKRGFAEARGEVVVTIDADGEIPAERIPDLAAPILEGRADMVQGRRAQPPRPSERAITWLAQRVGPVGDSGTGFRALRTELAKQLELRGACICGIFSLEVLSKGGRIDEIPIELKKVGKRRRIAWYHLTQPGYIFPWIFQRSKIRSNNRLEAQQ
jgi:glycosyltransferase involved in cell wall biosynthesis